MAELTAETVHTAEYWDERYAAKEPVWSGNVNQRLAEQTADLEPGDALDLGCGEGGDAVWLAEKGWTVLAADVSAVVVAKNAEHAHAVLGKDVAGRITWQQADVRTWAPPADAFDLVSMQYLHLARNPLHDLQARLARSVRRGGTLLIVNHDPLDLHTTMHRPDLPGLFHTADELAGILDPELWQIEVAEAFPRPHTDHEGGAVTLHDTVVRAARR